MNFVAWQMLTGDRAKYLGLIFAIAFSTFLMSHQTSIFCGLMNRTRSQILDVKDAEIWVMDPKTQYLDEVKALPEQDVYRVRSVSGVEWAVPLLKGTRTREGAHRRKISRGDPDGPGRRIARGSAARHGPRHVRRATTAGFHRDRSRGVQILLPGRAVGARQAIGVERPHCAHRRHLQFFGSVRQSAGGVCAVLGGSGSGGPGAQPDVVRGRKGGRA